VLFVVATQENRQADYTRQTENNLPGNQQGVLFPPPSVPIWYPEGWWGYYPVQYNARFNESANETDKHSYLPYTYPQYSDGRAYVAYESFYPIYNQNLTDAMQTNVDSPAQYSYVTMYPQMNYDDPGAQQLPVHTNSSNHCSDHDRFTAAADSSLIQNDTVAGIDGTLLDDEINHLDTLGSPSSGTFNSTRNVCPNENYSNETNGMITAMNIIDEEDGASDNTRRPDRERSGKTLDLRINVPNYTYVDTSDSSESGESSDSSDRNDSRNSSDSTSDNEHLSDSCQRDQTDDTTSNNTSSDSDSDSYLAYSTGLNPYEKLEEDLGIFPGINQIDATDVTDTYPNSSGNAADDDRRCDSVDDSESSTCSENICFEKNHINCTNDYLNLHEQDECPAVMTCERNADVQSDEINPIDRKMGQDDQGNSAGDEASSMIPHQLSVIYENMERSDSDSPYCENKKKIDGRNEASFERTDEPPDDGETTMVSVSLPLKFKFFVSEDNEDITTVTIGDSRIKEEKSCDIKKEMKDAADETDDVHVNFHIGNDTTVDFTLVKRHVSNDDACAITNTTPQVDFTLRRDFSPTFDSREDNEMVYRKQNMEENLQVAEINEMKRDEMNQRAESMSSNDDDRTVSESMTITRDICELNDVNRKHTQISQEVCNNLENLNLEEERMVAEPEVAMPECFWTQGQTPRLRIIDTNSNGSDTAEPRYSTIVDGKEERRIDSEFCQIDGKRLLSVDNREDTDDEDSGVTSDLSRMISEVDTDSECASSKNLKRYQRTQTHSRLFRLLNDDSVLTCSDCPKIDSSCRKEYLSLPLKPNAFNYDDSYCSNYSSGLTSPEYSPVLEQSWRKFYEPSSEGIASSPSLAADHPACQSERSSYKNDPYFRVWKNSKSHLGPQDNNVLPSLAFKILDSRMPSWAYKVNVLCPRIKSTKNVPQTLLSAYPARQPGRINDPLPAVILPIPTSCTNANTDYC